MPSTKKRIAFGPIYTMVLALIVVGCKPEAAIPLSARKPGTDLSPEARADKRGNQVAGK